MPCLSSRTGRRSARETRMSWNLPWILPQTQVPVVTFPSTVPVLFSSVLNTCTLTPSIFSFSAQNGTTNSFVPLSVSTTPQISNHTWSCNTPSSFSNLVPISTISTNTEPVYILSSDDVPTVPYSTSSDSALDLSMTKPSSSSFHNQGNTSIPILNLDVLPNLSSNTQSSIFANAYLWSFSATNTRCDCTIHVNR